MVYVSVCSFVYVLESRVKYFNNHVALFTCKSSDFECGIESHKTIIVHAHNHQYLLLIDNFMTVS